MSCLNPEPPEGGEVEFSIFRWLPTRSEPAGRQAGIIYLSGNRVDEERKDFFSTLITALMPQIPLSFAFQFPPEFYLLLHWSKSVRANDKQSEKYN